MHWRLMVEEVVTSVTVANEFGLSQRQAIRAIAEIKSLSGVQVYFDNKAKSYRYLQGRWISPAGIFCQFHKEVK